MTKKYIIMCLSFFLIFLGNSAYAEEPNEIVVKEIGSNYILGTYSGEDTISVFNGEYLLGQGKAVNNTFKIDFSQQVSGNSNLTLNAESAGLTTDAEYTPAVLNEIEDKRKVVSGQTVPGATITASVNGKGLSLKRFNKPDGTFEFKPSPLLKYKSTVKVVALIDGIKNVGSAQVIAAPAPSKPKVSTVTNKTNYISGYAEPHSEVNILIGKSRYTVRAYSTGYFKRYLPNKKPLSAGTVVSVYATADRYKSKSGIVTVKVADKIPPAAPRINKINNKSFVITGSAEAKSTIYVYKNNKKFKTIKLNLQGKFSIKIPLQAAKSKFLFYAKDSAGNQSPKTQLAVGNQKRPAKKIMYAPLIRQMPELPRGCEVTSLAMMLNQAGVKANKITLAKQVKKDPTIYRYSNGKKYFGNPNYGFVGNMYTFSKPGFGVYNKPIAELANKYMPGRIVNLSGQSFDSVLDYVGAGRPVWVINTSWFSHVPSKYWQTWYTPQGPVRITMKEHSVLITGYDSKYVYFNDPLDGTKNKKRLKKQFIEGWTQFGKQAISYY